MSLTSAADLQSQISTALVTSISESSLALSRGTIRRLSRNATSVKCPTLTVPPAANDSLESVAIVESTPTFADSANGQLTSIKCRVISSAEFDEDSSNMDWVSLCSSSIARRVDEKALTALVAVATDVGAVISAASMATAAAGMRAADLQRSILVTSPSQADHVYPLMENGKIYGLHEVIFSDALPSGCGGVLLDPRSLLVCIPPDALSTSRDIEAGAATDEVGRTVRYRVFAGCVQGIPAASFTDA